MGMLFYQPTSQIPCHLHCSEANCRGRERILPLAPRVRAPGMSTEQHLCYACA